MHSRHDPLLNHAARKAARMAIKDLPRPVPVTSRALRNWVVFSIAVVVVSGLWLKAVWQ